MGAVPASARDFAEALRAEAARWGASTVIDHMRRHPCLIVTTASGARFKQVFPGSGHLHGRARANAIAQLRRRLRDPAFLVKRTPGAPFAERA